LIVNGFNKNSILKATEMINSVLKVKYQSIATSELLLYTLNFKLVQLKGMRNYNDCFESVSGIVASTKSV